MSKIVKESKKKAFLAFKDKDYESALTHSQNALNYDDSNHLCLLIAGGCLAELGQQNESLEKYKKALEDNSKQTETYKGIIQLFCKYWTGILSLENLEILSKAYSCLIQSVSSDEADKKEEYTVGLLNTLKHQNKISELVLLLENALLEFPENIEVKAKAIEVFYENLNQINSSNKSWIMKCAKKVSMLCSELSIVEKAFDILLKVSNLSYEKTKVQIEDVVEICLKLFSQVPAASDCAFEISVQSSEFIFDSCLFDSYEGKYKNYVEALKLINENETEKANKILKSSWYKFGNFINLWEKLSDMYIKQKKYGVAENIIRSGLELHKELEKRNNPTYFNISSLNDIKFQLSFKLAFCLSKSELNVSKEKAVSILVKILSLNSKYNEKVYLNIIKTLVELNKHEDAEKYINIAISEYGLNSELNFYRINLTFKRGNVKLALEESKQLVNTDDSSYLAHFLYGKIMWYADIENRKDRTKCFTSFFNAAHKNKEFNEVFLYLGHYYNEVAGDRQRALKSYQKAYILAPGVKETGIALADILIQTNKVEEAIKLYEDITTSLPKESCKWAWLRLGLCYLKSVNQAEKAAKCFLSALEADSNDAVCYECLGESYVAMGSYTSAWKVFNKAKELNPNSLFSAYQMAFVNQVQFQYDDAIRDYQVALQIDCTFVPALKGITESYLSLARQMIGQGRDITALSYLNVAIQKLINALNENETFSCLWRLLGDCCSHVENMSSDEVALLIPICLIEGNLNKNDKTCKVGKKEALRLSVEYYTKAMQLCKNNAVLMNDLGFSYYRLALEQQSEDFELAKNTCFKAFSILKRAALLGKNNHLIWNNLGLVASSKFCDEKTVAQHSFITSIKCEANNWIAWCNLGVLYLTTSKIQLAHQAFSTAQRLQPSFVNSWVGQALIAEEIKPSEAMDLFRHSTELSYNSQAISGYTWWLCHTIASYPKSVQNKQNANELRKIITTIPKVWTFCLRNFDRSASWMALGFLFEQDNLWRDAEVAYKNSYKLLGDKKSDKMSINIATTYAKTLSRNSKNIEAVEVYKKISGNEQLNFWHYIVLGCVLSKAQENKEAEIVYNKAINLSENKTSLQQAKVSLAMHLWKCGKIEECKSILNEAEMYGYINTIAVLEENKEMEASMWMMQSVNDSEKSLSDITSQLCGLYKLKGQEECENFAREQVRRNPESWELQNLLTEVLSMNKSKNSELIRESSNETLNKFYEAQLLNNKNSNKNEYNLKLKNELCKISAPLQNKHELFRSKEIQKFVHKYPHEKESWVLLAAALQSQNVIKKLQNKNNKSESLCIKKVLSQCDSNLLNVRKLKEWSCCNMAHQQLMDENTIDMKNISESLTKEQMEIFEIWSKFIRNSRYVASGEENNKLKYFSNSESSKQLATHVLNCSSNHNTAFELLESGNINDQLAALKTCLDADENDADGTLWLKDRASSVLLKLNNRGDNDDAPPLPPVVMAIEALVKIREGNYRKSRYIFTKVFKSLIIDKKTEDLSLYFAVWYLYRGYVEKEDDLELGRLRDAWKEFDENDLQKLSQIFI